MKISHVLTILVIIFIAGGAVLFLREGKPDTVKDDKMEMIENREEPIRASYDVDARIREVIESDEYISSSILERKAIAEQLLNELSEDGLIKDIQFSEEDDLFSFEYDDGTLGGVMIRDFGSEEEPMN